MTLLLWIPVVLLLILPLVLRKKEPWDVEATPERFRILDRLYERTLRTIKDLEFDHQVGTLSDQEHARLRSEYKEKAIAVRRALERSRLAAARRIAQGKTVTLASNERKRLEELVSNAKAKLKSSRKELKN